MKKMIASLVVVLGLTGVASADGFSFGFGYSDGHSGGYVGYTDGGHWSGGGYSGGYYGGGHSGGYWGGYSDCYRPRPVCGHWVDRGYWTVTGYDCCGAPIRSWVSVRVWVND